MEPQTPLPPLRKQKLKEIYAKIRLRQQKQREWIQKKVMLKNVSEKAKKFAERESKRKLCFAERRRKQFKHSLIRSIKNSPWWILSSCLHLLLMVFFTHIFLSFIDNRPPHILKIGWYVKAPLPVESNIQAEVKDKEQDTEPEKTEKPEIKEPDLSETEKENESTQTPIAVPDQPTNPNQEAKSSFFSGRSAEGRGNALKKYGGSAGTEAAVKNGLDWLARHQLSDGSWSGRDYVVCCPQAPCDEELIYQDYPLGFTGLALLCFLGAGETHLGGSYQKNVAKGLEFLLQNQSIEGCFARNEVSIYSQAIATLAVVEAYGVTQDVRLKEAGQKGISFLSRCQQAGGGWDYYDYPTNRNDLSITGWVVMALKSARYAGLEVSPRTWKKAKEFVDRMYDNAGGYSYADSGPPANFKGRQGASMAGVGALSMLYFGEKNDSPRTLATGAILRHYVPNWSNLVNTQPNPVQKPGNVIIYNKDIYNYSVYAWYYGTLVMFQIGGEYWDLWNDHMKKALILNQEKKGCAKGSWAPVERWLGPYGGRMYMTTFNIMNLEIYYRYLPIYRTIEPTPALTDQDVIQQTQQTFQTGDQRSKSKALDQLSYIEEEKARKEAIEQASGFLEDESLTLRWKAIKTLRVMKAKEATPAILGAFKKKKNKMLRRFMIETLEELKDPSAFSFLIKILSGSNESLKTSAHHALQKWVGEDLGTSPQGWEAWWEAQTKEKH